jgi:hypothetical protein
LRINVLKEPLKASRWRSSPRALGRESLIGREDLERLVSSNDVRRIIAGHYHRAITAAFAGTIVSVCPSTAHQLAWNGNALDELRFCSEPPALLIHERIGDEVLTHLVPIIAGENLVLGQFANYKSRRRRLRHHFGVSLPDGCHFCRTVAIIPALRSKVRSLSISMGR